MKKFSGLSGEPAERIRSAHLLRSSWPDRRPVPPSKGGPDSRFENLGSTLNKGVEGLISVNFGIGSSVSVDASLSASHNTNRLVSLGVATYGPTCASLDALLQAADRALYAAKAGGGDRVALAS